MKKFMIIIILVVIVAASCVAGYAVCDVGKKADESFFSVKDGAYACTVYVWNKDKEPTKEGMRFALIERTGFEIPLWKIFLRGTSDVEKIKKKLTEYNSVDVEVCELYSYDGYGAHGYPQYVDLFKFIDEKNVDGMKTGCFSYRGTYERLRDDSAPKDMIIYGFGKLWDKSLSEDFEELGEGRIEGNETEVYRLSNIAGGGNLIFRVTVTDNGGELRYSTKSHTTGDSGTKVYKLTKEQIDEIVRSFENENFWRLENDEGTTLLDGRAVIIEAMKNGKHKIISRPNPINGSWYNDIFNMFVNLKEGKQNET